MRRKTKQNGYDVYRVVYENDNKFFVKWNNQLIDVTNDKKIFYIQINEVTRRSNYES